MKRPNIMNKNRQMKSKRITKAKVNSCFSGLYTRNVLSSSSSSNTFSIISTQFTSSVVNFQEFHIIFSFFRSILCHYLFTSRYSLIFFDAVIIKSLLRAVLQFKCLATDATCNRRCWCAHNRKIKQKSLPKIFISVGNAIIIFFARHSVIASHGVNIKIRRRFNCHF